MSCIELLVGGGRQLPERKYGTRNFATSAYILLVFATGGVLPCFVVLRRQSETIVRPICLLAKENYMFALPNLGEKENRPPPQKKKFSCWQQVRGTVSFLFVVLVRAKDL